MLALIKAALFPNVLAYNKTEAFKPDHVSNLNHQEEVKCFEKQYDFYRGCTNTVLLHVRYDYICFATTRYDAL